MSGRAGDEAVQEPRRHQQLPAVLEAQLLADPLAPGRAALADVDRHVEQRAAPAAHQLVLGMGRRLEMQPADRAGHARERMVVLHEIEIEAPFRHPRPVPAFAEEAAVVAEPARAEHQHVWNGGLVDIEHRALSRGWLHRRDPLTRDRGLLEGRPCLRDLARSGPCRAAPARGAITASIRDAAEPPSCGVAAMPQSSCRFAKSAPRRARAPVPIRGHVDTPRHVCL